ncbi:MAG: peptide chain release factor N(5)-glutamine methyltransferase [Cytophagales bacterium]|nr:MAG: peptide chain release factor N(5)-glutamine methyltransferase [Cytophagales bacterium]
MNLSARALFNDVVKSINIYSLEEKKALAFLILEKTLLINKNQILTAASIPFPSEVEIENLNLILGRINASEPIQYIFEEADFFGKKYFVNPSVLIPRQETEELVWKIVNETETNKTVRILDLCTGSGCIAISLAHSLPNSICKGIDISNEALAIATKNALNQNVSVQFFQQDVFKSFNEQIKGNKYDILVSNPPYVTESEKTMMHTNVLSYEPHLALFVSNETPLIFYEAILKKAKSLLQKGGRLYFEINESFGQTLKTLMSKEGFSDIEISKDIHGKDRIARATWEQDII